MAYVFAYRGWGQRQQLRHPLLGLSNYCHHLSRSVTGVIIDRKERHLLEVRNSEIRVTRPYFYRQISFLENLVDAHASSAPPGGARDL